MRDQYDNQTPMGTGGGPPVLTLRLEACRAAADLYGYPEALRSWLADGAMMIHRIVNEQDKVDWRRELPQVAGAAIAFAAVRGEDLADGD